MTDYLEDKCTVCAVCDKLILPGESVAQAFDGAEFPYTHCTNECSLPGLYCGTWGDGKLVPYE